MITNFGEAAKSESLRLFEFAEAYRKASLDICARMTASSTELTWPNANVAMMLAAHSVELFLKGSLTTLGALSRKLSKSHSIGKLHKQYCSEVGDNALLKFDPLFKVEALGFEEESTLREWADDSAEPSILYRYPLDEPGVEWIGLQGFEPEEFIGVLQDLEAAYKRIRPVLQTL